MFMLSVTVANSPLRCAPAGKNFKEVQVGRVETRPKEFTTRVPPRIALPLTCT